LVRVFVGGLFRGWPVCGNRGCLAPAVFVPQRGYLIPV
jgi:hypothetical protein